MQNAELVQIHHVRALGGEIRINKVLVGELVLGVVVDVLRHVHVEKLQGLGVGRVAAGGFVRIAWDKAACQLGDLVVLNPAQFGVLQPEVAFDEFDRGGETQERGVAPGDRAVFFRVRRGPLQRACGEGGAGGPKRFEERASLDLAGGKRPVAIDAGFPRGQQGAVGRLGCVQHARTASVDGSSSSG